MLRVTHSQTGQGPLYITDIDDGLPYQTSKHGQGDPKRYRRDGSGLSGPDKSTQTGVNYPKQVCYVPYEKPTDSTIAGYIDLEESDRVLMSQAKGVIAGMVEAGLATAEFYSTAVLAAPTVATAVLGVPGAGDLTISGTNLTSLAPNFTTVTITGDGAVTLTQAQIITGSGTISASSIVLPAALVPAVATTTSFVQVTADDQSSGAAVAVS